MSKNKAFKFLDKNSFLAYALSDGTIGVYRESIRLWRIKVVNNETANLKNLRIYVYSLKVRVHHWQASTFLDPAKIN